MHSNTFAIIQFYIHETKESTQAVLLELVSCMKLKKNNEWLLTNFKNVSQLYSKLLITVRRQ